MAARSTDVLFEQVRRLSGREHATDAELLSRFAEGRDEGAFEELLLRHGPMVLGVGRRLLGDGDAEDVLQATFLLLARQAASIRKRESVGCWLHGVAHRLALKARASESRRRTREKWAAEMRPRETPAAAAWTELQVLLDEALRSLPEKYRAPLVLCGLEGRSQAEAAARLGCPVGTVCSRLVRARQLLRARLARRGLTLSVATLALTLEVSAAPALPPRLMISTRAAASSRFTAQAAGGVPPPVAALVGSGLRGTAGPRSLVALAVLLAACLAAGSGVLGRPQPPGQLRGGSPRAASAVPPPRAQQPRTDRFGDPLPPGAVARLGTARFWSNCTWVQVAGFCAGGRYVVSFGRDMKVRLWDARTGRVVRTFEGGTNLQRSPCPISPPPVSPDGRLLAFVAATGSNLGHLIHVVDVQTGKPTAVIDTKGAWTYPYAFSPDGKMLAGIGFPDFKVRLYRVDGGKETACFAGDPHSARCLAFAPDGKSLAVAHADRSIVLWDTAGKPLRKLTGAAGDIEDVGFLDGSTLASAGRDARVRLWDVTTAKEKKSFAVGDCARAYFSPKAALVAVVAPDNALELWDVAAGKKVRSWKGQAPRHAHGDSDGFLAVGFAPDGKSLAVGNGVRLELRRVVEKEERYAGHHDSVQAIVVSPDGRTLATDGGDGTVRLWDGKGTETARVEGVPTPWGGLGAFAYGGPAGGPRVALVPGRRGFVILEGRAVSVRDAHAKELRRFEVRGGAPGAAVSPDGRRAMTADEAGNLFLWDVPAGRELRRLRVPGWASGTDSVASAAFSPDGRLLATRWRRRTSADARGHWEQKVHVWEVATGRRVAELGSGAPFAFAGDGRTLVTAGSDKYPDLSARHGEGVELRLWRFGTGKELRQIIAPVPFALSADGRVLAAAGEDGSVRLWDTTTGKACGEMKGRQAWVTALSFSADGERLASGGADTTVLLWNLPPPGGKRRAAVKRAEKELDALWERLAAEDPAAGWAAVADLLDSAEQALGLLKERLRPAQGPDEKRLAELMAGLDAGTFAARKRAADELERLGELAEPALTKLLASKPSLQARRQAERLLALLGERGPPKEVLRAGRALAVLEALHTPAARRLLKEVSRGAPASPVTKDAQTALERITRRTAP